MQRSNFVDLGDGKDVTKTEIALSEILADTQIGFLKLGKSLREAMQPWQGGAHRESGPELRCADHCPSQEQWQRVDDHRPRHLPRRLAIDGRCGTLGAARRRML